MGTKQPQLSPEGGEPDVVQTRRVAERSSGPPTALHIISSAARKLDIFSREILDMIFALVFDHVVFDEDDRAVEIAPLSVDSNKLILQRHSYPMLHTSEPEDFVHPLWLDAACVGPDTLSSIRRAILLNIGPGVVVLVDGLARMRKPLVDFPELTPSKLIRKLVIPIDVVELRQLQKKKYQGHLARWSRRLMSGSEWKQLQEVHIILPNEWTPCDIKLGSHQCPMNKRISVCISNLIHWAQQNKSCKVMVYQLQPSQRPVYSVWHAFEIVNLQKRLGNNRHFAIKVAAAGLDQQWRLHPGKFGSLLGPDREVFLENIDHLFSRRFSLREMEFFTHQDPLPPYIAARCTIMLSLLEGAFVINETRVGFFKDARPVCENTDEELNEFEGRILRGKFLHDNWRLISI